MIFRVTEAWQKAKFNIFLKVLFQNLDSSTHLVQAQALVYCYHPKLNVSILSQVAEQPVP